MHQRARQRSSQCRKHSDPAAVHRTSVPLPRGSCSGRAQRCHQDILPYTAGDPEFPASGPFRCRWDRSPSAATGRTGARPHPAYRRYLRGRSPVRCRPPRYSSPGNGSCHGPTNRCRGPRLRRSPHSVRRFSAHRIHSWSGSTQHRFRFPNLRRHLCTYTGQ